MLSSAISGQRVTFTDVNVNTAEQRGRNLFHRNPGTIDIIVASSCGVDNY